MSENAKVTYEVHETLWIKRKLLQWHELRSFFIITRSSGARFIAIFLVKPTGIVYFICYISIHGLYEQSRSCKKSISTYKQCIYIPSLREHETEKQ